MAFVQNVPFFCIMLSMMSAVICAVLPRRAARFLAAAAPAATAALNAWLLCWLLPTGQSYTYMMGHFPAPWGNELRAGVLEAVMATGFSLILFLSVAGGLKKQAEQVDEKKQNLFCVMLCLTLAALMSLVYTNDLFTAYVFIEIMTLAACAMIMSRQNGRTLTAAMRYMIMNLLGSGLVLIAITLTYGLTGHLLMENIQESFAKLAATGMYQQPMTVIIGLFFVGLGIKSALFPFHTWLPDAYGYSTPTSSAVLSSLVSKGYIFLLIKIFYRVIGAETMRATHVGNLMFVFGVVGMIMGSISAIRARDLRKMIAYSSVAQIGYIYAALGLGTEFGVVAALFHMLMHGACKSMLFLSASGLSDASGNSKRFKDLRGAGYRAPVSGVAFTVGGLSLIGVPLLGGFISKLCFSEAALEAGGIRMPVLLIALAISTLLNTVYFLHTIATLYRPATPEMVYNQPGRSRLLIGSLAALVVLNVLLGVMAEPLLNALWLGLRTFG